VLVLQTDLRGHRRDGLRLRRDHGGLTKQFLCWKGILSAEEHAAHIPARLDQSPTDQPIVRHRFSDDIFYRTLTPAWSCAAIQSKRRASVGRIRTRTVGSTSLTERARASTRIYGLTLSMIFNCTCSGNFKGLSRGLPFWCAPSLDEALG
jgi:hypothetical protein